MYKYVDDTTLTELLPCSSQQTHMQTFLQQLQTSATPNKMKINFMKTKEMILPRSFVTQPSPSAYSDNLWKLVFSTILIDSVSLLFCTFIGFLQFRHCSRFRDSFCLASVFKCLFTYLLTYSALLQNFPLNTYLTLLLTTLSSWKEYSISNLLASLSHTIWIGKHTLTR